MKKLTSDELLSILNECWGLYQEYGSLLFVGEIDFTEQTVELVDYNDVLDSSEKGFPKKTAYKLTDARIDEDRLILVEYDKSAGRIPAVYTSFIPVQKLDIESKGLPSFF